jgi:DNA segregation ATPase FtsK/SpoIIIE-like protein
MARTLSEFEDQDLKDLKALADDERFQLPFGPSALQRKLLLGYNRAARLIQSGIEAGVLYIPENTPHLAAFKR